MKRRRSGAGGQRGRGGARRRKRIGQERRVESGGAAAERGRGGARRRRGLGRTDEHRLVLGFDRGLAFYLTRLSDSSAERGAEGA